MVKTKKVKKIKKKNKPIGSNPLQNIVKNPNGLPFIQASARSNLVNNIEKKPKVSINLVILNTLISLLSNTDKWSESKWSKFKAKTRKL